MNKPHSQIALIGLGYWGKNLLRNLSQLDVLHTACDSNPQTLRQMEKDYPGVRFEQDIQKVLKDPEIMAVAIATPAVSHYTIVREALTAGKDVFVEKPLALKYAEGEKLVALAKKKKRILMVGHILQYHPAMIKLKSMIDNGELGKIQYIYSNRLNIGKLRIEENILWSFAPHDISVILMLIGDEPTKITGSGGSYLNEDIFDITMTTLSFKNQIKAHIFVSWLHPYKEQKLVVVGSQAMAVFDDMSKEKLFIYPHKITWTEGKIPFANKAEAIAVKVNTSEPLKEELLHFIDCIQHRKTPKTDGNEGLRVLNILQKAEKSFLKK
jgi:UDP-2-acetamido-3-amino-2,3-dideoxy-glucuronate N-acetyltransferase